MDMSSPLGEDKGERVGKGGVESVGGYWGCRRAGSRWSRGCGRQGQRRRRARESWM
jgi:hypothetical protein